MHLRKIDRRLLKQFTKLIGDGAIAISITKNFYIRLKTNITIKYGQSFIDGYRELTVEVRYKKFQHRDVTYSTY